MSQFDDMRPEWFLTDTAEMKRFYDNFKNAQEQAEKFKSAYDVTISGDGESKEPSPFSLEWLKNEEEKNKKEMSEQKKTQVGGNHYGQAKIQPIDFIMENKIPFCEANVIKYVFRHKSKNGIEDLEKAIHYIKFIIERDYKGYDDSCNEELPF